MTKINANISHPLAFSCFKEAQDFLGAPPILTGEDPEAYYALGQAIWEARSPQDFIEVMWVNDNTYHLWEALRLRRMKLHLISAGRFEAAQELIKQITGKTFPAEFWNDWVKDENESKKIVDVILNDNGLGDEAITAKAAEKIVDVLEKLERQSTQFEARRLATLREAEFYRENAELRRERSAQRRQLIGKGHGISVTVKDKNSGGSPKVNLSFDASQ